MSAFRERLRRLRREDATEVAAPAPPSADAGEARAAELPQWMRRRLGRAAATAPAAQSAGDDAELRTVGPPRDLVEQRNDRGGFAARIERTPLTERHGTWPLGAARDLRLDVLAELVATQALAGLDPRGAVFLDVETTGLGGGAGTHVFQVGLGRLDGDAFELWQGFLRGPAEAPAMLEECARRVADAQFVVSFFGKSFDRHRLEDQMRLHGVAPPFEARPHLDLYHPCRRLYAAGLPDGRLATMERALCGVERGFDLPGAHAPEAWFDFLAQRPHLLEPVFRHNRLDVLSLATLAAHLGCAPDERRPDGAPLEGSPARRAEGLARLHLAARRRDRALPWLERALERLAPESPRARPLRLEHAEALRLLGRTDEALAAFTDLGHPTRDAVAAEALTAAAKLHAARGAVDAARTAASSARALLDGHVAGPRHARLREVLERVEKRLAP